MIRCNHCGTNNIDGSEYCDECGTKLGAAGSPSPRPPYAPPAQLSTQVAPPPPPSFTKDNVTPKAATPYTPPPPPPHPSSGHSPPGRPAERQPGPGADRVRDQNRAADPAMNSAPPPAASQAAKLPTPSNVPEADVNRAQGSVQPPNPTGSFNGQTNAMRGGAGAEGDRRQAVNDENAVRPIGAKLIIQRGGKVGKEFPISGTESMIGRWDADGGIFPDIDLDQDDPEAKVSRRHARIQFLNNQYLIEDLGSTNGTFVNRGPRLTPGAKLPLNNGDEIIVGKTFLKFVLN